MITEVMKNIFMIEQFFPHRRVKSIDIIKLYLIRGEDRWLLIDTGLNEPEYEAALRADLAELNVDPDTMDLFISHMHPDHCGLVHSFKTPHNHIYATLEESEIINQVNDENYWKGLYNRYVKDGLSMDYDTFYNSYPPAAYLPEDRVDFDILSDGDIISIGGYNFECLVLPGHGAAHGCLYDARTGTLISCDTLLSDVAPILFLDNGLYDPLGEFFKSMNRIEALNVRHILACHGEIEFDVNQRIDELRKHYQKLCIESVSSLFGGPLNAREITELHTRSNLNREFDTFSPVSSWFFYIPILACMKFLAANGDVAEAVDENGITVYSV